MTKYVVREELTAKALCDKLNGNTGVNMLNVVLYNKALLQIEEGDRSGLGLTHRKIEGDYVYPEYVIQEYITYRRKLKELQNRKLP